SFVDQSTQCAKERTRIAEVSVNAAGMHDREPCPARRRCDRGEISFVVAIWDCGEFVGPQIRIPLAQQSAQVRCAGDDMCAAFNHAPLKPPIDRHIEAAMWRPRLRRILEPRIAEISDPWHVRCVRKKESDEMRRRMRACGIQNVCWIV